LAVLVPFSVRPEKAQSEDLSTNPTESNTQDEQRKVRGRPKSGRSWKLPEQKASTTIAVKPLHKKWSTKKAEREKEKKRKSMLAELIRQKKEEQKQERERIQNRRKQREANTLKSSQYQIIRHTSKIKNMSKKQRRMVMKLADLKNLQ